MPAWLTAYVTKQAVKFGLNLVLLIPDYFEKKKVMKEKLESYQSTFTDPNMTEEKKDEIRTDYLG